MAQAMQEQTAYKPEAQGGGDGRNLSDASRAASTATARRESDRRRHDGVMEAVVETKNMWEAYRRIVKNKGAPGVDGMTVDELGSHLKTHWARIKGELLKGVYKPGAVRKVEIPKPNGGKRQLGLSRRSWIDSSSRPYIKHSNRSLTPISHHIAMGFGEAGARMTR